MVWARSGGGARGRDRRRCRSARLVRARSRRRRRPADPARARRPRGARCRPTALAAAACARQRILCCWHAGRPVCTAAGARRRTRPPVRRALPDGVSRSRHRARSLRRGRHGGALHRRGAGAADRHGAGHRDDRERHDPATDAGGLLRRHARADASARSANLRFAAGSAAWHGAQAQQRVANRQQTVLYSPLATRQLLHHELDERARGNAVIGAEPIEHAEALDRTVRCRHHGAELLDRVAGIYPRDLDVEGLSRLALGERHAAEGGHRFAVGAIDLRRHALGREDEAIDIGAEAHGIDAEHPLVAFRHRGGGGQAVDDRILDALLVDVLDPAGVDVFGERLLSRHPHHVEAQGLTAAVLDAEHRLRGVVEREAVRRHESETELGMQKASPANEAFARILAVDQSVYIGEIFLLVAFTAARRRAELTRRCDRVLDALRRGRMRGEEVRGAGVNMRLTRIGLELGVASHRGEEADRAIGIEAGTVRDPDADAVGLELLGAREARERDLRLGERQCPGLGIAEHVLHHAAHQRDLTRLVLADGGVARDHVRHLMREHRGELGGVVGERDQPARHVELAGRQREGVDRRRVEDGHPVMHVRALGSGDQPLHRAIEHRFELGVVVGAVIGGEDTLVLARGRDRLLLLGLLLRLPRRFRQPRRRRADRKHRRAAAAECKPEQHHHRCEHRCARSGNVVEATTLQHGVVHALSSIPFGDLDLLGPGGFDARPVALLHPSPHPHAPVLELLQVEAARGENALVALEHGDRERLRPAAPEIEVDGARTFAHRPNLAFRHREKAVLGHQISPVFRPDHGIIRRAPKAKLPFARGTFLPQKLRRAGAIAHIGRHPGETPRHHLLRDRGPCSVALDLTERQDATVAVDLGAGRAAGARQHDLFAENDRRERIAGGTRRGSDGLCPRIALARARDQRNLEPDEADLATVIQDKAARVHHRADPPRRENFGLASTCRSTRGTWGARDRRPGACRRRPSLRLDRIHGPGGHTGQRAEKAKKLG